MMNFNDLVGYRDVGMVDGSYVMELEITQHHFNRFGTVHGGVLFSMLDTAMSRAFFDSLPPDRNSGFTLEMKINYLKAEQAGMLTAYGQMVCATRRTAFVEGRIENEAGDLVAKASGTMILKEPSGSRS